MKKNKKSIYKLYKENSELNSMVVISKKILKTAILCTPTIYIGNVILNKKFNYNENTLTWAAAFTASIFPVIEENINWFYMIQKGKNLTFKLSNICEIINDKTGEKINFSDANVSILGFQDNANETIVKFEFNNFYIEECIKNDVYKCGLYYSDGGFADLTNEVNDILKIKARRKIKNHK